jgi:type VI secretion system secreted protein Hcp
MKTRQSSSTRKAIQIVLATGVAVGAAQAQAATDIFLNISGLPGESVDKTHKGEIELVSYSQAVDSKGCTVTISKYIDKASPGLTAAAQSRSSFSSAILTARKAGGGGTGALLEYYKITMDGVTVLSADQSISESNPEQVVLSPKSMVLSYRPQKSDGSLDTAVDSTVYCGGSNGSGGGGGGGGGRGG